MTSIVDSLIQRWDQTDASFSVYPKQSIEEQKLGIVFDGLLEIMKVIGGPLTKTEPEDKLWET